MVAGAPEGHDAFVLGGLIADGQAETILQICIDDARMAKVAAALAFFHPGIEVLNFPAWDCLPYDRVSPNPDIISRRIDALTRLADARNGARIVLTTVNAAGIQRVPPRAAFVRARCCASKLGGCAAVGKALRNFWRATAMGRTETVREPGEFAIRGGIVDLYPSGTPRRPLAARFFRRQSGGGAQLRSPDPAHHRAISRRCGSSR